MKRRNNHRTLATLLLSVALVLGAGCGGAEVTDDGTSEDSDAGTEVGQSDDSDPSCYAPQWLEYPVGLVELDSNKDHPSTHTLHNHGKFDFVAIVESSSTEDLFAEFVLLLEHDHRLRIKIPLTGSINVVLPAVGDEVTGTFTCSGSFCSLYAISVYSTAGELIYEGGYIDPTAFYTVGAHPQRDFALKYNPGPAGESCTVLDNPNEGCWRTATPALIQVSQAEVKLAAGEAALLRLGEQAYYASVLGAILIESNCHPSDVPVAGAVAYIVTVVTE